MVNRQGDVEITEEMVMAGVKAMSGYDPDYISKFDLVKDVFYAMNQACRQPPVPLKKHQSLQRLYRRIIEKVQVLRIQDPQDG